MPYLDKESISAFIVNEGYRIGGDSCSEQCSQLDESELCEQECESALSGQLSDGVNGAVDELYGNRIYGISLNDAFSMSSSMIFVFLAVASGFLIAIVSKSPLSTLGKCAATSSVSMLAVPLVIRLILSSVSLPFDLGASFISYVSPGLEQQTSIGLAVLATGMLLIILNRVIKRKVKKSKN